MLYYHHHLSHPTHPFLRRHSILACGTRRTATDDGLRITLLGQSMIQHDLRETQRGRQCLESFSSSLSADVIFSELESAIHTTEMMTDANITPNT